MNPGEFEIIKDTMANNQAQNLDLYKIEARMYKWTYYLKLSSETLYAFEYDNKVTEMKHTIFIN